MDTAARHFLVELYDCDAQLLDDAQALRALLRSAAEAAGARVVTEVFHPFAPHGVTGVVSAQLAVRDGHLAVVANDTVFVLQVPPIKHRT